MPSEEGWLVVARVAPPIPRIDRGLTHVQAAGSNFAVVCAELGVDDVTIFHDSSPTAQSSVLVFSFEPDLVPLTDQPKLQDLVQQAIDRVGKLVGFRLTLVEVMQAIWHGPDT